MLATNTPAAVASGVANINAVAVIGANAPAATASIKANGFEWLFTNRNSLVFAREDRAAILPDSGRQVALDRESRMALLAQSRRAQALARETRFVALS
jgi:hypothetical protein